MSKFYETCFERSSAFVLRGCLRHGRRQWQPPNARSFAWQLDELLQGVGSRSDAMEPASPSFCYLSHIYTHEYAHMRICASVHVCIYVHIYIYIYTYECMRIHMYSMCMLGYVYIYIYRYWFIHVAIRRHVPICRYVSPLPGTASFH